MKYGVYDFCRKPELNSMGKPIYTKKRGYYNYVKDLVYKLDLYNTSITKTIDINHHDYVYEGESEIRDYELIPYDCYKEFKKSRMKLGDYLKKLYKERPNIPFLYNISRNGGFESFNNVLYDKGYKTTKDVQVMTGMCKCRNRCILYLKVHNTRYLLWDTVIRELGLRKSHNAFFISYYDNKNSIGNTSHKLKPYCFEKFLAVSFTYDNIFDLYQNIDYIKKYFHDRYGDNVEVMKYIPYPFGGNVNITDAFSGELLKFADIEERLKNITFNIRNFFKTISNFYKYNKPLEVSHEIRDCDIITNSIHEIKKGHIPDNVKLQNIKGNIYYDIYADNNLDKDGRKELICISECYFNNDGDLVDEKGENTTTLYLYWNVSDDRTRIRNLKDRKLAKYVLFKYLLSFLYNNYKSADDYNNKEYKTLLKYIIFHKFLFSPYDENDHKKFTLSEQKFILSIAHAALNMFYNNVGRRYKTQRFIYSSNINAAQYFILENILSIKSINNFTAYKNIDKLNLYRQFTYVLMQHLIGKEQYNKSRNKATYLSNKEFNYILDYINHIHAKRYNTTIKINSNQKYKIIKSLGFEVKDKYVNGILNKEIIVKDIKNIIEDCYKDIANVTDKIDGAKTPLNISLSIIKNLDEDNFNSIVKDVKGYYSKLIKEKIKSPPDKKK